MTASATEANKIFFHQVLIAPGTFIQFHLGDHQNFLSQTLAPYPSKIIEILALACAIIEVSGFNTKYFRGNVALYLLILERTGCSQFQKRQSDKQLCKQVTDHEWR
jgi:hypothetical protein